MHVALKILRPPEGEGEGESVGGVWGLGTKIHVRDAADRLPAVIRSRPDPTLPFLRVRDPSGHSLALDRPEQRLISNLLLCWAGHRRLSPVDRTQ